MKTENEAVEYALSLLAATAVFIALSGIAYRGILHPLMVSDAASDEVGPSYAEVCSRPARFTDAQFESYVQRFVGRAVTDWHGWLRWQPPTDDAVQTVELASQLPGDLTWGKDLELVGVPAAALQDMRWGQPVRFSGTIRHVKIWGAICQPVIGDVTFVQ